MRFKAIIIVSCIFFFVSLMLPNVSGAHFLWINPRAYQMNSGQSFYFTLGFGHLFPGAGGDFLPNDRVQKFYFIDPAGKRGDIIMDKYQILFRSSEIQTKSGTYLIFAERKGGFYTKTVEGFRLQSKEGLSDVLFCKYSRMYAKSLVNIEKPEGLTYEKKVGAELEIIPLKNPGLLKVGEYLPVTVLLRGKPFKKQKLYATHEGFSTSNLPAFSYVTKTDSHGNALIRLDKRGVWLIMARFEEPFEQKDKCDYFSLVSTLTFEIR